MKLYVIIENYMLNWNMNHIGLNHFIPKPLKFVAEYKRWIIKLKSLNHFCHGMVSFDTCVNLCYRILTKYIWSIFANVVNENNISTITFELFFLGGGIYHVLYWTQIWNVKCDSIPHIETSLILLSNKTTW